MDDLRFHYFERVEYMLTPPRLVNTDGEPLEPHTLRYRLTATPAQAEAALASLAKGLIDIEQGDAGDNEGDEDGEEPGTIEICWAKKGNKLHKSWDNTILGHLYIGSGTLRAEVNSAKRARRLERLIANRLGTGARLESVTRQSAEAMMRKAASAPPREEHERDPALLELERTMREQHLAEWVDTALPLLGGRTPRQAVRERDGRDIVISLVADWERRDGTGLAKLRRELGLPER